MATATTATNGNKVIPFKMVDMNLMQPETRALLSLQQLADNKDVINGVTKNIIENIKALFPVVVADHYDRVLDTNIPFAPSRNAVGYNYFCSDSDCSPEFEPYFEKVRSIYSKHLNGESPKNRAKVDAHIRMFFVNLQKSIEGEARKLTEAMENKLWRSGSFVQHESGKSAIQVYFHVEDRGYLGSYDITKPVFTVIPKDGTEVVGFDLNNPKVTRVFSVPKPQTK